MARRPLLSLLGACLALAAVSARGEDFALPRGSDAWLIFPAASSQGKTLPRLAADLASFAGDGHRSLVLAVPVMEDGNSYSLCLLYDYARTDKLDPISASGLGDFDGNRDARNLGLGLRRFMTEKLEFQAVVGHSHSWGSSNSAYAGIIYNVDQHLGFGADLGRVTANGRDNDRLRAFARFYF